MNIPLTDLEAVFLLAHNDTSWTEHEDLDIKVAQGIKFLDPKGFVKNKGNVGTCDVVIWFKDRHVPDTMEPLARWIIAGGTSVENLTLTPSIDLTCKGEYPNEWHGFITQGVATNV